MTDTELVFNIVKAYGFIQAKAKNTESIVKKIEKSTWTTGLWGRSRLMKPITAT